MKKILALLSAVLMVFALCACGQTAAPAAEAPEATSPAAEAPAAEPAIAPVVLRVSMAEAATDNKAIAIEQVKKNIEERTEGRVVLEIYCNGELGTFQEDVEAITQGANIVDGTSPAAYCDYGCADMMALDLMKMIQSPEECDALNESELFKDMCAQLEEASGIKVLAINGTLSLIAGIDLLTGIAIPVVSETHKSSDFICLLEKLDAMYPKGDIIRIICDNHSAHKSKEVQAYLSTKPEGRFVFVFTPAHGSWLNLIEGFFSKMTKQMQRGIRVASKQELEDRIYLYFDEVNADPVVFHWSYKLDDLSSVVG